VTQTRPLLLFNDECGVCRYIAAWVAKSMKTTKGEAALAEQPIGDDPDALRLLDPDLDIWDAYATIHLLMPDGSMKLGGEAVAEVLRRLPPTRWLAKSFAFSVFGWRPFQTVLDVAYTILADVRPLLGCESCGVPSRWVRAFVAATKWVRGLFCKRATASTERQVVSVANLARQDGIDILQVAPKIGVVTTTTAYPLLCANEALADLRAGCFEGAAVLVPPG
jgi:predicted DCC family thiol-disulfide oxidoreductase YuxK